MAQSPNAMQEPSMDELLASIREIIEENTGPSPNRNANRHDTVSPEAVLSAPNNSASINSAGGNTNLATATNTHQSPHTEIPRNEQQFNKPGTHNSNTSMDTPPVLDAMDALAARIGLRHNERPENLEQNIAQQNDSTLPPPAPAAMILKKVPAEPNVPTQNERSASMQPRPAAQNPHNNGNISANSGNFNPGALNQGNAQNTAARQMNVGGSKSLNLGEHPNQVRSEMRPHTGQNPSTQQHPMGQPRQMEPLKAREVAPQRDGALPKESQGEGFMRQQPMQTASANPNHDNRHLPPSPRVANTAARPNQQINPTHSNNPRENTNDARLPNEMRIDNRGSNTNHNVQAENGFEPRGHQESVQDPTFENTLSREGTASQNTSVQPDKPQLQGHGTNIGSLPETRNQPEVPSQTPRPQTAPTGSGNTSSNKVPYPRSAPQKPHFLSQALRSAFLSIPAKDSAFQTASSLPQAPLRPQKVSAAGIQQPTRVELKAAEMIEAEVKREMDNLDKALEADFKNSAENLLRPYIAKWLDEHFSELFEKVLREEIKRVIQAQLR